MKLTAAIGVLLGLVSSAFGAGQTPISNLKLVGSANGNLAGFTNLSTVVSRSVVVNVVTAGVVRADSVIAGTATVVRVTSGYALLGTVQSGTSMTAVASSDLAFFGTTSSGTSTAVRVASDSASFGTSTAGTSTVIRVVSDFSQSGTSTVVRMMFQNGTNTASLTQQDVASMQGTVPDNELRALYAKSPSNASPESAVATKGFLSSTNAGSEGISRIGALGGYTLEEFLGDTALRGAARDLPTFVYSSTNLNVSWSGGDVYDPENGYYHLNPGSGTLVDNAVNYAYWSPAGPALVQWTTGARPSATNTIYLATFSTAFGVIYYVDIVDPVGDTVLLQDEANANAFPSLIIQGVNVFATGTNLTDITIASGTEYRNLSVRIDHPSLSLGTASNLVMYCHTGGVWTAISTNKFPIGLWDNGTNITACSTSMWYRGVFLAAAGNGHLDWVLPRTGHTNSEDAIAGDDPDVPPGLSPYTPLVTAYVFSGLDASLRTEGTYWPDRRLMIRRGDGALSSVFGTAAYSNSTAFALAAAGVSNGNSHDHSGGDGAQIAHGGLSGITGSGALHVDATSTQNWQKASALEVYMTSNITATITGTYTLGNAAHYYLTTTGAVTFAMAAANKYATSVWLLGTNAVSFPAAWKNYNNTWVKAASGTNLVYVAPQGTNWVYTGGSASL